MQLAHQSQDGFRCGVIEVAGRFTGKHNLLGAQATRNQVPAGIAQPSDAPAARAGCGLRVRHRRILDTSWAPGPAALVTHECQCLSCDPRIGVPEGVMCAAG